LVLGSRHTRQRVTAKVTNSRVLRAATTAEGASCEIIFKDCVIGTNEDGVGNGVKIVDNGSGMHDMTFEHCVFRYQPKIDFERIGRTEPAEGGAGGLRYRRIDLLNAIWPTPRN